MKFVLDAAADTLRSRAELQFEILALRQQLGKRILTATLSARFLWR